MTQSGQSSDGWRDGAYTLLYTDTLLTELVDVLGRPRIRNKYNVQEEDVRTLIALILLRGVEVVPTRHYTICRDPRQLFYLTSLLLVVRMYS